MSLKYVIPNEDMDQLVCSSCSNHLSIFPIYVSNGNSGVICGRCTPFNKDNIIRDEAYEAIAEFLQFPCRYKKNGCEEQLTPHRLVEHEPTCPFRIFECPSKAYTKCDWSGKRADLVGHFEKKHVSLLLKTNEFEWSFATSIKENLLSVFEKELFIVKKDLDARKQAFSCSVQHFAARPTSGRYNYIIKLVSDDKNSWCKLSETTTKDGENVTATYDYVKEKLNDPGFVLVQIEIVQADKAKEENSSEKTVDVSSVTKNPNLNWEVLNELECPICYVIMSGEIYQCTSGHSICSDCKRVIQICPLCRKNILDIRNFTLEKLTPFLIYPCKYYSVGCTFTSKCSEIKKHEEQCDFGPFNCPLKEFKNCELKISRSQIVEHVENMHNSFVLKSNRITSPFDVDETRECCYLMKYSEKVFLVRYKYTNRKFYWTVQLVGSAEDCKKFKFDIDVIDNSKRKLRCYLRGFCVPMKFKIDFTDPLQYIVLTYEQLQPLITSALDYTIHISTE